MPRFIFRETPPRDLVSALLQGYGLHSIEDLSPFTKSHINLTLIESLLPLLEQYYIPCKAQEYLHHPLTHSRALTILRQILKSHDISLNVTEKSTGGVKTTWYSLQTVLEGGSQDNSGIEISFN
jgi:hypothetical protein